jgi:hypothetical protein
VLRVHSAVSELARVVGGAMPGTQKCEAPAGAGASTERAVPTCPGAGLTARFHHGAPDRDPPAPRPWTRAAR